VVKPSTNVKVGLFVLVALALIVAGILVLGGAGNILRPTVQAETYINESVQGLDVGSPVKYRGVQIGRVNRIGFVRSEYPDAPSSDLERMVLVRITLFPSTLGGSGGIGDLGRELQQMIAQGLRIRLASQGLTGTAYLEVDYVAPDQYPALTIAWEPNALYIPSAPSRLSQFTDAAETVMQNLQRTDIARLIDETTALVEDLRGTGSALRQFFDEKALTQMKQDLGDTFANLKQLSVTSQSAGTEILVSLRQTVKRLDEVTSIIQKATAGDRLPTIVADAQSATANLRKATNDLPQTMALLRGAIQRLDGILVSGQGDIGSTLDNIHVASENLRQITENAKRYPSQILFGAPPPGQADRR
jgi:ABC-type transporter Mla subunit MlaD